MFKIKEKIKQWVDRIINGNCSRGNLDLSHKKLKKFPVPPKITIRGDFSYSQDLNNKSLERTLKSILG